MIRRILLSGIIMLSALTACNMRKEIMMEGTYGFDKQFLENNDVEFVELYNNDERSAIIVVPAWQGRVMTSGSSGPMGKSFGWINYEFISSKIENDQFNVYGGEERFWLGPEGGKYSLYFKEGEEQVFENWKVPAVIDTEGYNVLSKDNREILMEKDASLLNSSGNCFDLKIKRKVTLIDKEDLSSVLGINIPDKMECVAYSTENVLKNTGNSEWTREKGLISIWMLSMFAPSPETTVFIPFNDNEEISGLPVVNDDYFGRVPDDRLVVKDGFIFFRIDGEYRSKIGVPGGRAGNICGSYDARDKVLTVLKYNNPAVDSPYLNGRWGKQDDPFSGDVINSYNDGPLEDGSIMGPFYEIESSSPGAELAPGDSIMHLQQICHFRGKKAELDSITNNLFGISLDDITRVFRQ